MVRELCSPSDIAPRILSILIPNELLNRVEEQSVHGLRRPSSLSHCRSPSENGSVCEALSSTTVLSLAAITANYQLRAYMRRWEN